MFGGSRSVSSYILHVHFIFVIDKSTLATAPERFWSKTALANQINGKYTKWRLSKRTKCATSRRDIALYQRIIVLHIQIFTTQLHHRFQNLNVKFVLKMFPKFQSRYSYEKKFTVPLTHNSKQMKGKKPSPRCYSVSTASIQVPSFSFSINFHTLLFNVKILFYSH